MLRRVRFTPVLAVAAVLAAAALADAQTLDDLLDLFVGKGE